MFGGKTLSFRFTLAVVLGAMITFALGAFGAKSYLARKQSPIASAKSSPFLIEGFDFHRASQFGERVAWAKYRRED